MATSRVSVTGVPGKLIDTRSDALRRNRAHRSTLRVLPSRSVSVEIIHRRSARSCSLASSANSDVGPPISCPRRETSASTWMTPSWTCRESRSRSCKAVDS
ncbi:two-component system sensor kinase domain protein [Mycobacterium ulcerans str. Harvey]|uniref:Two-component system sensor kinase domain protein n=1 Tax=Mycobacterium ulcerans str. Harvey TaxID=1299332 RepID=A0ABN0QRJ8_MYCUL|nr:two-component system sensor kinase domain protein [Mycobacterium ulcerans str. Harvey]